MIRRWFFFRTKGFCGGPEALRRRLGSPFLRENCSGFAFFKEANPKDWI